MAGWDLLRDLELVVDSFQTERRSVEVSVPPPGDSYRVVAGKRMTVSLGGNNIIEDRTTSW